MRHSSPDLRTLPATTIATFRRSPASRGSGGRPRPEVVWLPGEKTRILSNRTRVRMISSSIPRQKNVWSARGL